MPLLVPLRFPEGLPLGDKLSDCMPTGDWLLWVCVFGLRGETMQETMRFGLEAATHRERERERESEEERGRKRKRKRRHQKRNEKRERLRNRER